MLCPRCRSAVDDAPDLSGQLVACPYCGERFQMPVFGQLLAPPVAAPPALAVEPWAPQPQQPVTLVIAPAPAEPRLRASGWFSRGFSASLGVILAWWVGCMIVLAVGLVALNAAISSEAAAERSLSQEVRELAAPKLRQFGIMQLASDCRAIQQGDAVSLVGHGKDAGGRMHSVSVHFYVATFGDTKQWQVRAVVVDDETVFVKE